MKVMEQIQGLINSEFARKNNANFTVGIVIEYFTSNEKMYKTWSS